MQCGKKVPWPVSRPSGTGSCAQLPRPCDGVLSGTTTKQATEHLKICQGSASTIFTPFSANWFESAVPVTWAMQVSDAEMGGEMGK